MSDAYRRGIEDAKKVVREAEAISLSMPSSLPSHMAVRTQAGWIIEELDRLSRDGGDTLKPG